MGSSAVSFWSHSLLQCLPYTKPSAPGLPCLLPKPSRNFVLYQSHII